MSKKVSVRRHKRKTRAGFVTVRKHQREVSVRRAKFGKYSPYAEYILDEAANYRSWTEWLRFRDWAINENIHDMPVVWGIWKEVMNEQHVDKRIGPTTTLEYEMLERNSPDRAKSLRALAKGNSSWENWPRFRRHAKNENFTEDQAWGAWIDLW